MAIPIGATAPDVTLYHNTPEGVKPFSPSDFRNKKNVVLLFVPMAFTGVCTKEFCTVRDTLKDYEDLNAEVIGISCDSPYTLAVWGKELQLTMSLGSDYNHEATRAFDVEHPIFAGGLKGVSKRSAFVIDKEGIIRYSWSSDNPTILPNFEEIQSTLKSLA